MREKAVGVIFNARFIFPRRKEVLDYAGLDYIHYNKSVAVLAPTGSYDIVPLDQQQGGSKLLHLCTARRLLESEPYCSAEHTEASRFKVHAIETTGCTWRREETCWTFSDQS